jgi:hypothetical protein
MRRAAPGMGKPRDGLRVALEYFGANFAPAEFHRNCDQRQRRKLKTTASLEMSAALIQAQRVGYLYQSSGGFWSTQDASALRDREVIAA